jgi:hypothetical protein
MKLPLISLSLMFVGACVPVAEQTSVHLSDGRQAIALDAAPLEIDQRASELCPYGYTILSRRAYQDFPHTTHEQMVITCNPLPKDFPQ